MPAWPFLMKVVPLDLLVIVPLVPYEQGLQQHAHAPAHARTPVHAHTRPRTPAPPTPPLCTVMDHNSADQICDTLCVTGLCRPAAAASLFCSVARYKLRTAASIALCNHAVVAHQRQQSVGEGQ